MQHIDRYLNYLLLWASNLSQIKEQFSLFRRFAVNGFLPNEINPFTSYLLVHCVLRLTQSNLVAKNGRSLLLTHEPLLVLMREKLSNNQKGTYFRLHPLKLFFRVASRPKRAWMKRLALPGAPAPLLACILVGPLVTAYPSSRESLAVVSYRESIGLTSLSTYNVKILHTAVQKCYKTFFILELQVYKVN